MFGFQYAAGSFIILVHQYMAAIALRENNLWVSM